MATEADLQLGDVACANGELRATLCVPASHPILPGHFPGAPIVPGVLLLEAVRRACECVHGAPLAIAEVLDVRFSRPVAADERVALRAQIDAAEALLDVTGEWSAGDARVALFRLRLVPARA